MVLPPPDFKPPNIIEKGSKVKVMVMMMIKIIRMMIMMMILLKVKYNAIGKGGHDWTSKQSQKSKAAATSIIGVEHQYINIII